VEITLRVNAAHGDSRPRRIEIRADEQTRMPYAGLAITGQLELVERGAASRRA